MEQEQPDSSGKPRVVVIGAGVGGLATAIALRQRGIEATVFERRPDMRKIQIGAGIHLWQNAVRALQQLEVADRVEAAGEPVERMEWRTPSGEFIAAWPVGDLSRELGAPAVGISRANLFTALAGALDESILHLGENCTGFTQDAAGVTVQFTSGRVEHADVLVGADGINSIVRSQLRGQQKPRYAGYTLWQAVVQAGDLVPAQTFRETWGSGKRFGFYPVQDMTFWFGMKKAPEGGQEPDSERKAIVLGHYQGWAHPIEELIRITPDEAITRLDIVGRNPIPQWGEGRATILGDAAHPMTPNLGQGACQAIEDALVLADCLATVHDPVTALRTYEERRRGRTASIVRRAWYIGSTGRWQHPVSVKLRNRIMKTVFPTLAWKQQRQDMAYKF